MISKKYFFILLLGVACLASGGIFVKLSELGPVATAFHRILLAMPLALLWARFSHSPRPRAGLLNVPHGDFALMFCSGAFLAFDLILWHISFHYTTVANANLLANLVPFIVVPSAWILFGERPSKLFAIGLFVAVAGVVLLMSGKINPSPDNFFGDALAIATALFYGLYLVTVGRLRERYNAGDILFWGGFSALAILLTTSAITEDTLIPQTMYGILILCCLAVFSQIGGQGLIAVSFGRLPINFASVAVLMQPVIAAFYALVIFSEKLSWLEIASAGVVLGGIYIAKIGSNSTDISDYEKIRRKLKLIYRGGVLRLVPRIPDSIINELLEDLKAFRTRNSAAMPGDSIINDSTGFYAICAYRLAHFLLTHVKSPKAQANAFRIYNKLLANTGIDIDPRARIGKRCVIDHGQGVVIGETCAIGNDCYILGGAILGGLKIANSAPAKRHPSIGNNVEIGGSARILGPVNIGDNTLIAPYAVITENVPAGSRVVIKNQLQITKE